MKKEKVNNKKTIFDDIPEDDLSKELSSEEIEKEKRRKKVAFKKANRVMDRIFGFMLAIVFAVGIGGLSLVYMLEKGPSPALNDKFIHSMLETRRFDFIADLFLTSEEVMKYSDTSEAEEQLVSSVIDTSLFQTDTELVVDSNGADKYGLVDDDGDGIIYNVFTYHGSTCYMIVVLDPSRVFVGVTNPNSGGGLVLDDLVAKYGARGGINAGIFEDTNGSGNGWPPIGITISQGETFNDNESGCLAGISEDGILYVGYLSYADCVNTGIRDAVSFDPILILNGEIVDASLLEGGISSRTCIGQRADKAIVMLVVDGRQAYSIGISQLDAAEIMFNYGCINALNMDGGNSSSMYLDGELKNHPSNPAGGTRYLPDAWLFK